MKERTVILVLVGACVWAYASTTALAQGGGAQADSTVTSNLSQQTTAIGGGNANSSAVAEGGTGVGWSNSTSSGGTGLGVSDSASSVNIETTSFSNYTTRTPPMTTYPPSLPFWTHGGWGAINGYFPNGPSTPDKVYERVFDPSNPRDMRELRGILQSVPHRGPLEAIGGILFNTAQSLHRGRGIDISNSLIRDRRPCGKPLLVFIDSYMDTDLLRAAGYAYVGRLSLEGSTKCTWDHVYSAAVAESLPWDVDILLVSGGMKGVSVGSNTSFPMGGYGFSQTNYSLSLFGTVSSGITEGKGEAMLSAAAYRFCPELIQRREIPLSFSDRFRLRPKPAAAAQGSGQARAAGASGSATGAVPQGPGITMSKQLYDMAGFSPEQRVSNVTIR